MQSMADLYDDGAVSNRARSFGTVAPAYEQFRPGYPEELVDAVLAYAGQPIRSALEIGAGTGKATRLFAHRGVEVTATDPDPAMLAELRKHVPATVATIETAFEDLRLDRTYDLVYAAAALHWTNPEGRWSRVAGLLKPGGVFASFGGPFQLTDPALEEAVRRARAPYLETDAIPTSGGPTDDDETRWPRNELERSPWFTDVQVTTVEGRLTMTAHDFVGHLSTISAYLQLAAASRQEAYERIAQVLPEHVEITADITVHLARRVPDRPSS
jgi:SAM-dependent methyltransferase